MKEAKRPIGRPSSTFQVDAASICNCSLDVGGVVGARSSAAGRQRAEF